MCIPDNTTEARIISIINANNPAIMAFPEQNATQVVT
jgi:hypothetical protein